MELKPFALLELSASGLPRRLKYARKAPDFAATLSAWRPLSGTLLARGVERALRSEIYDAADSLFKWVRNDSTPFDEQLRLLPFSRGRDGWPLLIVRARQGRAAPVAKINALISLFDALSSRPSPNGMEINMIEATAVALSRALGSKGQHSRAVPYVDRALRLRPRSIHLKASRHALCLAAAGAPVPERLKKFVGDDNGFLERFVCPEPFKRFDVSPSGEVLVCCGHWVPTPIGNLMESDAEEIANSPAARAIRESVCDGSYKYCNHLECTALIRGTLPTKEETREPAIRRALDTGDCSVDHVEQLLFAFDQTCNLSCPSCRTSQIVEKDSLASDKARIVADKVLPLLPKLKVLNINPAGELFASRPSRRLLEAINPADCPDLVLDIISNGTLFTEAEWDRYKGIHGKVRYVRISVDAARKETFETLRRPARYETFLENMRFLSRLRAAREIPQLNVSFTYQLANFREMREFAEWARSLGCDYAIFERLQNLGAFTEQEFADKAVHIASHPDHTEFLEALNHPIFRDKHVWHDFDFPRAFRTIQPAAAATFPS